jgi:L-rhamnose mutarotase
MIRRAFTMKLRPGCAAEYKKRHDEIWPELKKSISKAGISDYTIFLDEETMTLFAVQRLSDNNTVAELPKSPLHRKWWDYMKDLMECNPDNTPVRIPLKEMFHID